MSTNLRRNIYMTDELEAIYHQTVDFVSNEVTPHGDAWEEAGKVPREVLQQMGALGMLSLRIPEELGGLGMGMLASATFSEALGASTFAGFDVTARKAPIATLGDSGCSAYHEQLMAAAEDSDCASAHAPLRVGVA